MPIDRINGVNIYHESHGAGFPLIFIHGGFGGLGTGQVGDIPKWVDRFAQKFEVILYDRRSSGRSDYPVIAHTMSQLAGDLHELLNLLGHEKAHIWGTSAGGPIALTHGLEHPAATQSLVVSDSAPFLSRDAAILEPLRRRLKILEKDWPGISAEIAHR